MRIILYIYIYMYHICVYSVYTVFRVAFWIHLFTRYVDGQRLNHPSNYVSATGFLAAHGGVLGTLYVMVDTKVADLIQVIANF